MWLLRGGRSVTKYHEDRKTTIYQVVSRALETIRRWTHRTRCRDERTYSLTFVKTRSLGPGLTVLWGTIDCDTRSTPTAPRHTDSYRLSVHTLTLEVFYCPKRNRQVCPTEVVTTTLTRETGRTPDRQCPRPSHSAPYGRKERRRGGEEEEIGLKPTCGEEGKTNTRRNSKINNTFYNINYNIYTLLYRLV